MAITSFTGVRVVQSTSIVIDYLFKQKTIVLDEPMFPNLFVVLKAEKQSALGRVDATGRNLNLISDKLKLGSIKPRNKEQLMAMDMLLDKKVTINVMTGKSGSGKTILTLAAALQLVEEGSYSRIILTRPMASVGKTELGFLPGNVKEKFDPYLGNFQDNLSQLGGGDSSHAMERFNVECIPIQLMRGRSFLKSFIICDEIQILTEMEFMTIGTRVGEGSKIVMLGDLQQRDVRIAKTATGLYKFINSSITKESPLAASIELLKNERSPTSLLFSEVFEGVGND